MSDAPVEVRVGDRERRLLDERLQAAVGDGVLTLAEYDERAAVLWQARTRGELDALVVDLPPTGPAPRPVAAVRTAPQRVIAVMSEDGLSGALLPGQQVEGYAVLGKAVVDLRREDLPDGVRVRVWAVMGEAEVQVPPGSQVLLSGLAVMGERKVRVAPGEGPVVHVDAYAVMGSVNVTVGDGHVLPAGSGLPAQRHAAVPAVPQPPRPGLLARIGRRVAAGALPVALLVGVGAVVASGTDGRVVFGSTTVDSVDDARVEVSVLFGSVEVVVPDDARVDRDGLVVFGSVGCNDACDGSGDGEVVTVRSVGGFGSVEIVTQSERDVGRSGNDPVVEVEEP